MLATRESDLLKIIKTEILFQNRPQPVASRRQAQNQPHKELHVTNQITSKPKPEPTQTGKLIGLILALIVTLEVYRRVFLFLRDGTDNPWVMFAVSLLWGIGGVWFLFVLTSSIVELFPIKWRTRVMPWVFVAPALAFVFYYLLIPTFRTIFFSFYDATSAKFIGLENYQYAFTSPAMLESFRNNLAWLVFGGGLSVVLGLFIAALTDRTRPGFEVTVKTLVFLPMAISMISASAIWRLMYAYNPGANQIGLLNAIQMALGGQNPIPWMLAKGLNTYLLIVILIWMQTGFAVVVFSAAIKGVPSEMLEAARIDGATELQSFFRITVPVIQSTIVAVSTTILIGTLKVFDIVFGMTGGNFGTQIIANEQYTQTFRNFDYGRGSAVAIVLLLAVLPVVYYNIRDFAKDAKF
jgi:alpha-glucoside transport system permease protein